MFSVTVPRTDLTSDQVAAALRQGLGPEYNVMPGMRMSRSPFGGPRLGPADSILVGIGSNRLYRAQVTLKRSAGTTKLCISPGGLAGELILNILGIARKTHRVLSQRFA